MAAQMSIEIARVRIDKFQQCTVSRGFCVTEEQVARKQLALLYVRYPSLAPAPAPRPAPTPEPRPAARPAPKPQAKPEPAQRPAPRPEPGPARRERSMEEILAEARARTAKDTAARQADARNPLVAEKVAENYRLRSWAATECLREIADLCDCVAWTSFHTSGEPHETFFCGHANDVAKARRLFVGICAGIQDASLRDYTSRYYSGVAHQQGTNEGTYCNAFHQGVVRQFAERISDMCENRKAVIRTPAQSSERAAKASRVDAFYTRQAFPDFGSSRLPMVEDWTAYWTGYEDAKAIPLDL